MDIINALEVQEMDSAHGVSVRALHSTEYVQVVMIMLEPGGNPFFMVDNSSPE